MMPLRLPLFVVALALFGLGRLQADEDWQAKLHHDLPLLGHRNWIVVVDSAYPWQVSPGVETVETNEDMPTVIKAVLEALSHTRHVRPVLFTDAELPFVSEADAPGVTAYRAALHKALGGKMSQPMLHNDIIRNLDEAGKTFHVLVLKTNLTIPYTSLFLRLDCAYWADDSEQRLRAAMSAAPAQPAAK